MAQCANMSGLAVSDFNKTSNCRALGSDEAVGRGEIGQLDSMG
jgi:hypothetical protein